LGEDSIKRVLRDLNITDTEADIYLYVAKHLASKGTDIARQTKKDKAQVYHLLKNLQSKGLIEATLESPVRYTPVPFERVIDQAIEAKREEAQRIEKTKTEVLAYWKALSRSRIVPQIEKFLVIEGRKKLNAKLIQMIAETENQISAVVSVQSMLKADQDGIFELAFKHPLKHQIQLYFLTELSTQNLAGMKAILKNMSSKDFNFRVRNSDLGLHFSQHFFLRDRDELLLFIQPRSEKSIIEEEVCCLWTNCKSIVETFMTIFEDSWHNSSDIHQRLREIKTGKFTAQTYVIKDPEAALKKYRQALKSTKEEVMIVTSSNGLKELNISALKAWKKNRVSTRIMAPIISENIDFADGISNYGEIKHVAKGLPETTIIDNEHLFQFQTLKSDKKSFENVFYSNEAEYVHKTQNMLNEVWNNAKTPSAITLNSIASVTISKSSNHVVYKATKKMIGHTPMEDYEAERDLTEKSIIEKIINARKNPPRTDAVIMYSTNGQAIINPPSHMNLPTILFHTYHMEKHSTHGAEDSMMIHLWLNTPNGEVFVPCAALTDTPEAVDFYRKVCANTPAETNVQLVKKNEIEACIHGNTLFIAWSVNIPLLEGKYSIPPSCLQIEGYGKVITTAYRATLPSGYTFKTEGNLLEAFVTYLHPTSKYSGPGTDGALGRDTILEFYPPKTKNNGGKNQ
jgi:HTH-type transcriptional regulator, sugar sensing transcriptional regulator